MDATRSTSLVFALALALSACGAPDDAPSDTVADAAPGVDAGLDVASVDAPVDAPRMDVAADVRAPVDVPADAPRVDGGGADGALDASAADAAVSSDAPGSGALRIVVLSDLNDSYGSTTYGSTVHAAVTAITTRLRPDLVLVTGDMVAGQRAGLDYGAMWAGWHRAVSDPLRAAGIPMAVTPGNHDASGYAQYAAERSVFVSQWTAPSRVPRVTFVDRSRYPLRYTFTHRGVFFVSLDATTVGPLLAEQRQWVDAQLAASMAPVKIAYGHLSLHPVTVGRETEVLADAELEAIFRRRGLTAYVSGHQHGYYPGARNGLRLVSMACLGAGPRALVGTTVASPQAMLVLEVRDGRVASLEALAAPGFTRTIARSTLPAEIRYGGQRVTRDDLAGF